MKVVFKISCTSAEFTGMDGWCELNLNSEHNQNLLRDIKIKVLLLYAVFNEME